MGPDPAGLRPGRTPPRAKITRHMRSLLNFIACSEVADRASLRPTSNRFDQARVIVLHVAHRVFTGQQVISAAG